MERETHETGNRIKSKQNKLEIVQSNVWLNLWSRNLCSHFLEIIFFKPFRCKFSSSDFVICKATF